MSLVPLFSELEVFSDVESLLEDTFGLGIHPVDIFHPHQRTIVTRAPRRRYNPYLLPNLRPNGRGKINALLKSEPVSHVGKDGFQVCMDVSQFTPNELSVKTLDRSIVVEGKHEEREDEHGFIQRHFVRKYTLPKDYDPKDVVSTISSDGILTVKAPPTPSNTKNNERIVQIQQTGPAHLSVKQPEEPKKAENGESPKIKTK